MVAVVWTRRALSDLADIDGYIAQFDPHAAAAVSQRLHVAGNSLSDFPNRGRRVADGVRVLPNVPPYLIYHDASGDTVTILSIRHGRRRPIAD